MKDLLGIKDAKDFWLNNNFKLPSKRKNYQRDWRSYNNAKMNQFIIFLKILNDVVNYIDIKDHWSKKGRYPVLLQDIIKAGVLKCYLKIDSRTLNSYFKFLKGLGYMIDKMHPNTFTKYMRRTEITPYLPELIKATAEPLIPIEKHVSVDSTGYSTFNKRQWIDYRMEQRLTKQFLKLHIMTGVKSNIIIDAKITDGNVHDSTQFEYLVKNAIYFNIEEISGDSGYLSRKACQLVADIGAIPYILPKKNVIRTTSRGYPAWNKMIRLFRENEDEFRRHYHLRSNVESTFSMLKRNMYPYVMSKNKNAQVNEMLMKIIAHNIMVLIQSIFEFKIKIDFLKE